MKSIIEKILDSEEMQEKINQSTLFNAISKAFIRQYPAYYDIINTYDYGLEHINDILKTQRVLDENVYTGIKNVVVRIKMHIDNLKIFPPGSAEHKTYSIKSCSATTPNEALKTRTTYTALLLGDIYCSYQIINVNTPNAGSVVNDLVLKDKYKVNIPIPIGSKYCALRQYDPLTLIRTGEDMEGAYGYFIIQGFIKYLIPYFTKPFNAPIVLKNNYDNQLARCDGLYSSGLDYENSYYIIGSILRPQQAHFGRGINQIPILDFVFSLQMNEPCMNRDTVITRKKSLINSVPIKYLFYAFGCTNDLEMLKCICPDMNDCALISTVRQACLQGKYHVAIAQQYLDFKLVNGYLQLLKPLNIYSARFVVGQIILNDNYKKQIRDYVKDDINAYKREIIRQVNRLLRTKFMPGIGRINMDNSLYDIPEDKLTPEQALKISEQEKIRNRAICYELGQIVRKLYRIGVDIEPSMDRISLTNKRIRHGQQIEHEVKGFHNARIREVKVKEEDFFKKIKSNKVLESEETKKAFVEMMNNMAEQISINQSTSLINAFKGTVTKEKSKIRTNLLTPKNQSFMYSMIREIVISTDQKARGTSVQWEHRVVHPSHLYFIDPIYCPESGPQVGRYQQPTLYTYLTTGSLGLDILKFIEHNKNFKKDIDKIGTNYIIKLNGSTIGYIDQYEPVEELYESLMKARAKGEILRDCSIILKHMEGILEIWCDEGRMMTPFVNIKNCFETSNGQIGIKPNFLKWLNDCAEAKGDTDYIDKGLKEEFITLYDASMAIYNACVADSIESYYREPWKYNCIALPLHLMGYVTSANPSIVMNAGLRGSYSSNHMKQAIGPTFRYPQIKYLNEANVLLSPQIPVIRTCAYDLMGYNHKPTGVNVIIAFLVYTDNQEDCLIVNRSSVENGLLIIDAYTVKTSSCEKQEDHFAIPDNTTPKICNPESYLKLDSKTCMPKNVGDKFYEHDAIIAKITQYNLNDVKKLDRSTYNNMPDGCHPKEANTRELRYVNKDYDIDHDTKFKMAVMSQRKCMIAGDKFNSTHAQKSTLGRIYNSTKMPYTKSGIKPDIIFNPPSVFKRNTCGQIYEAMAGKIAALLGCPMNSTPFQATSRSLNNIDDVCKYLGIDPMGYEDLYEPESGRKFGKAFLGVMQYQRQQHILENKLNIRAFEGEVDKITGLAVKGRKRGGAQSIDRMSNDSINASGAVMLNRDLHLESGAKTTIAICGICHKQYTYYSKNFKCWFCSCCGRHNNFIIKEVVPAEMLINHIFNGMHIAFEYRVNDKTKDIIHDIDKNEY